MKKRFVETIGFKYLVDFIFLLGLSALTAWSKELLNQNETLKVLYVLSDCFTIPGILFILASLLTWVGSEGGFDMIGYGFYSLKYLFSPSKRVLNGRKTYYDYKQDKEAKGKIWEKHLLFSGLIYLGIGIIIFVVCVIIR